MEARRAFVVLALSGLSGWKSFVEVPKDLGMVAFQYRIEGEVGYVTRLSALEPALVVSWAGRNNATIGRSVSQNRSYALISVTWRKKTCSSGRNSDAMSVGLESQRVLMFRISV